MKTPLKPKHQISCKEPRSKSSSQVERLANLTLPLTRASLSKKRELSVVSLESLARESGHREEWNGVTCLYYLLLHVCTSNQAIHTSCQHQQVPPSALSLYAVQRAVLRLSETMVAKSKVPLTLTSHRTAYRRTTPSRGRRERSVLSTNRKIFFFYFIKRASVQACKQPLARILKRASTCTYSRFVSNFIWQVSSVLMTLLNFFLNGILYTLISVIFFSVFF